MDAEIKLSMKYGANKGRLQHLLFYLRSLFCQILPLKSDLNVIYNERQMIFVKVTNQSYHSASSMTLCHYQHQLIQPPRHVLGQRQPVTPLVDSWSTLWYRFCYISLYVPFFSPSRRDLKVFEFAFFSMGFHRLLLCVANHTVPLQSGPK